MTTATLDSFRSLILISAAFIIFARAEAQSIAVDSGAVAAAAKTLRWQCLLHFAPAVGQSEITNPSFFYAPDGPQNPEAELVASIQHLLNDGEDLPENSRFYCRYPARRTFIETWFGIKAKSECPQYEAWRNHAEPSRITFVHAAQYVGNPASAFGHSFLRFDRRDRPGLLGVSLTFSARVDVRDNPIAYALKGLLGGYEGVYEFGDYYPKVHGYNNLESRELWEYELKLTPEQQRRVFDHAWELTIAGQSKYFFFNRNCTFQLLQLLDVADDGLNLARGADHFYLTPPESVKALKLAGLIRKGDVRPSMRQRATAQFERLDREQQDLLRRGASGEISPEVISDPQVSSALVATLALNELENPDEQGRANLFSRAAAARSQLPVSRPNSSLISEISNLDPLATHRTAQARIELVNQSRQSVMRIAARPALHALTDSPQGFLPFTQLVFLDTTLEATETGKVNLHQLTFVDIKSIQPRSFLQTGFSWNFRLALEPVQAEDCEPCRQMRTTLQVGLGVDLGQRNIAYALAGGVADILQPKTRLSTRYGPTVTVGLLSGASQKWIAAAKAHLDQFLAGPFGREATLSGELGLTWHADLNTSWAINYRRFENLRYSEHRQSEVGLQYSNNF